MIGIYRYRLFGNFGDGNNGHFPACLLHLQSLPDLWLQAFDETGIAPADYAHRRRDEDEWLPWDHIDAGVTKAFLLEEKHRAERGEPTPDCRLGPCTRCGACKRMRDA